MQLNEEQGQMVVDNQRLVYHIVHRMGIFQNSPDYEDIVSIGTYGLIKAVMTFKEEKGNKFATYASRCITNEIGTEYRVNKKHEKDVSISEPIAKNQNGNELMLEDTLEDNNANFFKKILKVEECTATISIILNYLRGRERLAMLYHIGGVTQGEIAEKLDLYQKSISRLVKSAQKKIRKASNKKLPYKEVYNVNIVNEVCVISFASKDVSNFKKIFATLLQDTSYNIPNFKINYNKEQVILQVPEDADSFYLIAKIIQGIDEFSIALTTDKN